jgi:putative ABC transport system permease protein
MKTFLKTTFRMYLSNWSRFLANFLVVFISIALCSGLGGLSSIYKRSLENLYNENNINQITIKCKTSTGFSSTDVEKLSGIEEIKNTSLSYVNDYKQKDSNKDSSKEYIYRVSIIDFKENNSSSGVNKICLEGNSSCYIQTDSQILIKKPNKNLTDYKINETISLDLLSTGLSFMSKSYTICGYVSDAYYSCVMPEVSYLNTNDSQELKVDCFIYLDSNKLSTIQSSLLPKTDLNISLNNPYSFFDNDNYFNYVNRVVQKLKNIFGEENYSYLTLNENTGFKMFGEYMDKIAVISYVFPAFFIAVCLLVCLITLSRLIDEERSVLACYQSLGIQKWKIYFKYILFGCLCSLIGGILGIWFGMSLIPQVVFSAIQAIFDIKTLVIGFDNLLGIIVTIIVIVFSGILVYGLVYKSLRQTPSSLFIGKASKPGKKILFERIKFVWKRLPFKYKSSIRNIFRNKKNGILTILSIIGSYILLFLGLALLDVSNALINDELYGQVADSIKLVSVVIVLFSISMCIIIIFNIANLNILERNRELATLKVLGYTDRECSFYTFREILIVSIFAIILSIPCGYLVGKVVFSYLNFGSIEDVRWFMYVIASGSIFVLTLLVNLLLYPKIKKVDMNDSLKILE